MKKSINSGRVKNTVGTDMNTESVAWAIHDAPKDELVEQLCTAKAQAILIGRAPAFQKAIRQLPAIAKSDATVLITGETGTGKDLVARAIHYMSQRAAFPFVPINCGALPETLLEAVFFGHERGAFTDAHTQRRGLIAHAEKGTLFLDEIEALSQKAQASLLHLLQDKKFRAIGSSREQQADVRIMAATNAPLDEFAQAGRFRDDLYYRLNVLSVNLPPLRYRKKDIIPLVYHFLEKHALVDRESLRLSPSAHDFLLSYDWPGNVRQLENAIIRTIHLCQGKTIEIEDLGISSKDANFYDQPTVVFPESCSFKAMKQKMIEAFEKDYLKRLMRKHQGNVTQAALTAGKERRALGKMLKKYRIDPKLYMTLTKSKHLQR